MQANVLAFPTASHSPAGWSTRELAEIYRLTDYLGRQGLDVEIESGVSDEGDPWLVVTDPQEAEVSLHIARIDGQYMLVRDDADEAVHAHSMREIVTKLIAITNGQSGEKIGAAGEDEADSAANWLSLGDTTPGAAEARLTDEAAAVETPAVARDIEGERLEQIGNALLAMIVGVAKLGIDPTAADEIVITTIEGADRETAEPTVAGETLLPVWDADAPEAAKATGSEFEEVLLVDGSHAESGAGRYGASDVDVASIIAEAFDPVAAMLTVSEPQVPTTEDSHAETTASAGEALTDRGEIELGRDDELIIGSAAGEYINAGDGNDTVLAGDGDDIVVAGRGDDIVEGGNGNDVILGQDGNDTLQGGDGDDSIAGGGGNNVVNGGNGNDLLVSTGGHDSLTGGNGSDFFVVIGARPGNVSIDDFEVDRDHLVVLGTDATTTTSTSQTDPASQTITVNPNVAITVVGTTPLEDPLV